MPTPYEQARLAVAAAQRGWQNWLPAAVSHRHGDTELWVDRQGKAASQALVSRYRVSRDLQSGKQIPHVHYRLSCTLPLRRDGLALPSCRLSGREYDDYAAAVLAAIGHARFHGRRPCRGPAR